jgi:streptomycin 6-kinase
VNTQPDPALIASILELESLRIIGRVGPEAGGSGWMRLVEDPAGVRHYLKFATVREIHQNEPVALAAWQEHGLVPEHRVLNHDPLVILVTDVGGEDLRSLDRVSPDLRRLADITELARALHAVPPPEGLFTTRDLVRLRSIHDEAALEAFGIDGARILRHVEAEITTSEHESHFVHGDFHHRNILVTVDGPKAIDPFGLVGDRACDLAFLAARRDDPSAAYAQMLDHYGEPLPHAEAWFIWSCHLAHLHMREREGYAGAPLQEMLRRGDLRYPQSAI